MTDRNTVKWQPFSAVIPGTILVNEILKQKSKQKMPALSEDQIYNIQNKIIFAYQNQSDIKIKYFKSYQYFIIEGKITKIDKINKKLTINLKNDIFFSQIIEIR